MDYFTSDLHLFHEAILALTFRKFRTTKEMNRTIVRKYNDIVSPDDTCYILGDLQMEKHPEPLRKIIERLNGRKILILGNHDEINVWHYLRMGFESVHTSLDIGKYILIHDPVASVTKPDRKWLCGHVHNMWKKSGNCVNVGVDVWDFNPVSEMQIDELFDSKEKFI